MKNFVWLILLLSLTSSCGKNTNLIQVGYQNKNKFIVDSSHYDLVDSLNSFINKNNLNSKISSYEIKSDVDEVNNKKYFYIVGISSSDSTKIATLLIKKAQKFYFDRKSNSIVICHNCSDSNPKYQFNDWGWTCESDNLDDCKKIIIVNY